MTRRAVENFIGKAVVSDEFRQKLMAWEMTREGIAAVNPDLDLQDVNAIVIALMSSQGFPSFSKEIGKYIDRRYSSGLPAGDNLPISV